MNNRSNIWNVFKTGLLLGCLLESTVFFFAGMFRLDGLGPAVLVLPEFLSSLVVPARPEDFSQTTVLLILLALVAGIVFNALTLALPYFIWRSLVPATIHEPKSNIEISKWA